MRAKNKEYLQNFFHKKCDLSIHALKGCLQVAHMRSSRLIKKWENIFIMALK